MGYENNDRRYGRDRGGYGGQDRSGYGARAGGDYRSERGYDRGGYDRGSGAERYGRGAGYDRDPRGYDYDDRGFMDRAGDEVRSWFGDDDAERRRRADERHYREEYEQRRREWERNGGRGDPYANYAGMGFDGYGLGMPPFGAAPFGYGDYDRGPSVTGDRYGRGDQGYGRSQPTRDRSFTGRDYSQDRGRDQHDQSYQSWRDRQMQSFDRDYDDYRREHQSKFESDFGSWRQTRETQRGSLKQAKEHQEVVGSDGQHLGTVDHVRDDRIVLTKSDPNAAGHHHSIPVSWIDKVDDKVTINKTAEEAKRQWRDEEQNSAFRKDDQSNRQGSNTEAQGSEGPHALNRSFRGTY